MHGNTDLDNQERPQAARKCRAGAFELPGQVMAERYLRVVASLISFFPES